MATSAFDVVCWSAQYVKYFKRSEKYVWPIPFLLTGIPAVSHADSVSCYGLTWHVDKSQKSASHTCSLTDVRWSEVKIIEAEIYLVLLLKKNLGFWSCEILYLEKYLQGTIWTGCFFMLWAVIFNRSKTAGVKMEVAVFYLLWQLFSCLSIRPNPANNGSLFPISNTSERSLL